MAEKACHVVGSTTQVGLTQALALIVMAYLHVLAKLAGSPEPTGLFADLTEDDLRRNFLVPYETGQDFLANNKVVKCSEVVETQIIATNRNSETELAAIQQKSKEEMDRLNDGGGVVFIGFGRGYSITDIPENGVDVTANYIKGPPGYRRKVNAAVAASHSTKSSSHTVLIALLTTVVGGLLVAWLAKAFGWV